MDIPHCTYPLVSYGDEQHRTHSEALMDIAAVDICINTYCMDVIQLLSEGSG